MKEELEATPFIGDNNRYNYFYKIVNNLNSKVYYGVHSTETLNDGYMGSGTLIRRAIKKYGIERFKKIILNFFEDKKSMYAYEKNYLNQDFLKENQKYIYNLKIGGHGGWDKALSVFKEKVANNEIDLSNNYKIFKEKCSEEEYNIYLENRSKISKRYWENLRQDEVRYKKYIENTRNTSKLKSLDKNFSNFIEAGRKLMNDPDHRAYMSKTLSNREGNHYKKFKERFESLKSDFIFLLNTNLTDIQITNYYKSIGDGIGFDHFIEYLLYTNDIEIKTIDKVFIYHKDSRVNNNKTIIESKIKHKNIYFINFERINIFNKISVDLNNKEISNYKIYNKHNYKGFQTISEYLTYCEFVESIELLKKPSKTIMIYNKTIPDAIYIDENYMIYRPIVTYENNNIANITFEPKNLHLSNIINK